MPYRKRPMRRRRPYRKRGATTRRPTNFNNKNMLTPNVYPICRQFENLVVLENPPSGGNFIAAADNMVVGHVECNLGELPGYTELTSLFAQYKLNAVTLTCTPTYQQDVDPTSTETVICDIWRSNHGDTPTAAFQISDLLQIQKRQTFIMPQRKSFKRSMMLNQLSNTYAGTTNNDYTIQKPRYLSTSEGTTPHYGINFCFRRPDGAAFTTMSPRLLMNYNVKSTFKQII